jgi:peptidoglycan/LPS O-acetylase OafA/YrhL
VALIHFFSSASNRIGNFLGNISYSIYLLHSYSGALLINYLSHMFKSPLEKFIVISLGLFFTIGTSFIFWKLIEKPSQKMSQKISTA